MGWTINESSFDSRLGREILLFPRRSTAVLDPSQLFVSGYWESGVEAPFPGVKSGRGAITAVWCHGEEYTEIYHHTPYAFIAWFLNTRPENLIL